MLADVPSPPPLVRSAPARPVEQLAGWRLAAVTCGGAAVQPIAAPRPLATLRYNEAATASVDYRFTIGPAGRPLDIARTTTGWVEDAQDLAPSLATARFAAGAREGCSARFTRSSQPVATAPLADLLALGALTGTPDPSPARTRIDAASGDCGPPYPEPALRAFPDRSRLARTPGVPSWTSSRFDIDARGRPVRLSVAASSGGAALDRAALAALARSRFRGGARHGCLLPYRIAPATLPPPEPPAEAALRPAGATCPEHLPFAKPPTLTYPQAWRRRAIEGWAMLGYDVAPWGEIGNVRVLMAEPSAEFGDWATTMLPQASKPAGPGYTGCVERVRFRIGDRAAIRLGPDTPALVE